MAFWRGDEHRRVRQSDWRAKLQSVTVPRNLIEEEKMADAPKEGDVKLDAQPAPAPAPKLSLADKAKAFFAAHKSALLIAAAAVVLFVVARFI